MSTKKYLLCGVLALLVHTSSTFNFMPFIQTETRLINILLKRRAELKAADPEMSTKCFDIYLPQLRAAYDQWSTDYENCTEQAGNLRNTTTEQITQDKTDIITSSNEVCDYVRNCQVIEDSLDFFNCFSNLSGNALQNIFTITDIAADDVAVLTEQKTGSDLSMSRCTDAAQRTYVEQTATINNNLDNCLQYGPPQSDDSGSTETDFESTTVTLISEASETTVLITEEDTTDAEHTTLPIMSV